MSSIKDVAREAGVSAATVSYVLNGTKKVSAEVEERVWQAARKLNYRPNTAARNLRRSETRTLGYELLLPRHGDVSSLMQRFSFGLTLEAARAGYDVITFVNLNRQNEREIYRQMILSERVDGFIIANTNWRDERIHFLLDEDFPFVSFGRTQTDRDFAYVDVDGYAGIQKMVVHLVAQGHRQLAFCGWPENSFSGDNRFQGFRDAVMEAGLPFEASAQLERTINTVEGGYQAAANLMAHQPSAIVCVSDVIALGVVRYLHQHGYQVGQEIAVSGFDDIPLAQFITPPLTTLAQPIVEIEKRLVQMLLAFIRDEPVAEHQIVLEPELIIRESTRFQVS